MNIEQIKYIIEVNKVGTITKAADILHISPSALSQSINQVENELDVKIFLRTRKGMIPTLYGKTILTKFHEMLKNFHELKQDISLQKKELIRTIKVACAPSMTYLVTKASLLLKSNFEGVNIVIEEMEPEKVINKIKKGETDIGISQFIADLQNESDINYEYIFRGYVCVCLSKQSHLYYKDYVTSTDLRNETMVLYNTKPVKTFINQHLKNNPILLFSNNSDVIRSSLLDDKVFTLIYNFTFRDHPDVTNKKLAIIPFKNDSNLIYQDFGVFFSATKGLSELSMQFQRTISILLNQ